jgi:hypothetical protein
MKDLGPVEEPDLLDIVIAGLYLIGIVVFIVLLCMAFKALEEAWAI